MVFSATDNISPLFALLIIIVAALAWWWRRRTLAHDAFVDGSALLAYYTYDGRRKLVENAPALAAIFSLKEGELGDGSYFNIISVNADRLIYIVQLPFQTSLHVLAVAQTSGMDEKILAASGSVNEVELEGDFPDYFHLYVTPGEEERVRYILDPEAMGDVIDFCRTNSWELLNDELYVIVTRSSERVITLKAIEGFVAQIRPVIAVAATASNNPYRMSQEQAESQLRANCPVCSTPLVRSNEWHECPNGHGYLLTGEELARMRKKQITVVDNGAPDVSIPHTVINCPACGNTMLPIPYVNGHAIIDSCQKCQYRWLDGGEERQIAAID